VKQPRARFNEIDEQIGEAWRSISAISPIALRGELKCGVILAACRKIKDEWASPPRVREFFTVISRRIIVR